MLSGGVGVRRTRLVLGGVVAVVLGLGAGPAMAYVDSGADPGGDTTDSGDSYDIRSTVRSVVQGPRRKNLRIGTRLYEPDFQPGSWVFVDAKLDARGGRQADAVLHLWILDMSGSGCELQTRSGRLIRRGSGRFVGEAVDDEGVPHFIGVSCRVPVHRLHATKDIRWKVTTIYGNGEPVFDVAPNEGMYS